MYSIVKSYLKRKFNNRTIFPNLYCIQSFSHGTNDAQKSMGIITLALIVANLQTGSSVEPQLWVKIAVPLQWFWVQ